MSVVFSLPHGASYSTVPVVSPVESLAKAGVHAENAYQKFLAERAAGRQGWPMGDVLPPVEIPVARAVQQVVAPVGQAWALPPGGANYPTASAVPATATAIPTTARVIPAGAAATAVLATAVSMNGVVRQSSVPQFSTNDGVVRQSSVPQFPMNALVQRQSSVPMAPMGQPQMSPVSLSRPPPGSPGAPMVAAPVPMTVPASPAAPGRPTDGLIDPTSVDRQKLQHARTLLDKLQADTAVLTQQNQVRKQMLAQYGAQQKAQHATQVESDLQREAMAIEQRGNAQLLQVQQAVMAQTLALEKQAAGLTLRYQCQLVEEDRQKKDYATQRTYYENELKIAGQMQRLVRGEQPDSSRLLLADSYSRYSRRDADSFGDYLGNPGGLPRVP